MTHDHGEKTTPPVDVEGLAARIHAAIYADTEMDRWVIGRIIPILTAAFAEMEKQLEIVTTQANCLSTEREALEGLLKPSPCNIPGHCAKDWVERQNGIPEGNDGLVADVIVPAHCRLCHELEELYAEMCSHTQWWKK